VAGDDWTREEVEAVVEDYRHMLIQQYYGQVINKAEHNRRLRERLRGRSKASVEFKHRNISAVLVEIGFPGFLKGYVPSGNFQGLLHEVLTERLIEDPDFERAASHASDQPAVVPMGVDFGVWVEDPPAPRVMQQRADYRANSRVDYVAREARNRALGLAGEELVVAFERDRLERAGQGNRASLVDHYSQTHGDGAGFDVLSFEADGRERFIEVKTTSFAKSAPFYISRNEVGFSDEHPDQYRLYRLFEFRDVPKMFEVRGRMSDRLSLHPVSFLATVNAAAN
jgi:hypothetical protein